MAKKSKEEISLDISNYWTSSDFLKESNEKSGTLVAFDWVEGYLSEINTNIDLGDLELDDFRFDTLVEFLQNNNFTFVLGLRNIDFEDNPSKGWTDKLKEILKSNDINYDEYIVDQWPLPVPEFDVPDNIFILRYSYDEYNKIDQFAAHQFLFQRFMKNSEWELYYKEQPSVEKDRIIVFISNIENFVLKDTFVK
tara:strand:- start:5121 stop:5705 length:585 start_codon:yes stop_codon:yes gene_type:complete